ncbi:type I glyceraldehyde-3-phosphate dehydrogenase [Candidatus Saccharibacteria bacterium]|nr:MAG: type I glyceraldehyde-3-phosphate dehydrogenase [Candidatus Saccharibacteria bacterium]
MAKIKLAINGFGRIGRSAFKVAFERHDIEIVAINDLTDNETLAYLLKNDSNYGSYHHEVKSTDDSIVVDGREVRALSQKDPAQLPWGEMGVDVVIESTGLFRKTEDAKKHIQAGAKRVVISAPAKDDETQTVVIGVNEDSLDPEVEIVSNASCTTNSLASVMAVLDQEFGIEKSMLTTVHSYTASQSLQDGPAKDLRTGRNASENIVPTSTGAALATAKVYSKLEGKFDGISMRVPTPVVSISDITALLSRKVTVEEVNSALERASNEPFYQGIIGVSSEPLVSCDFIGNSHSGIVDLPLTRVVDGDLVKVCVWYDNEWGYSNRLVELAVDVGRMLV